MSAKDRSREDRSAEDRRPQDEALKRGGEGSQPASEVDTSSSADKGEELTLVLPSDYEVVEAPKEPAASSRSAASSPKGSGMRSSARGAAGLSRAEETGATSQKTGGIAKHPTVVVRRDGLAEQAGETGASPVTDESVTDDGAGEQLQGEDPGDVFVILPEQLEGEIPVVETEVVNEEEALVADFAETQALHGQASGLQASMPGGGLDADPTQVAAQMEATESAGDGVTQLAAEDQIEQLTSQLDDDVLTESVGDAGDPETESLGLEGRDAADLDGEEALLGEGAQAKSRFTPRRMPWVVGSLAAMALLALTAYFVVLPRIQRGFSGEAVAAGASAGSVAAYGAPGTVDAGPLSGAGGAAVESAPGGGIAPGSGGEDKTVGVRQAFRDRVSLAFRLGFPSEVRDE
jgi:hypothetical protein